jgi:hypothetical protein
MIGMMTMATKKKVGPGAVYSILYSRYSCIYVSHVRTYLQAT